MKKIFTGIFMLFAVLVLNSQNMTSQFSKTVSYIYFKVNDEYRPNGTAFIISVPSKTKGFIYIYLVTAKHVLKDKFGKFYNNAFARVRIKNNISKYYDIPLDLSEINKTFFTHRDESVDLVIIPIDIQKELDLSELDFSPIPISMIINRTDYLKENIDVGTEVFFSGLFTPYIEKYKINPIFRFGKLCLIPNEKIMFAGFERDLLLIESSTFGGNSGSPVVFQYKKDDRIIVKLGGVVLGSFNNVNKIPIENNESVSFFSSLGVSAITPSEFILDILNYPELELQKKD